MARRQHLDPLLLRWHPLRSAGLPRLPWTEMQSLCLPFLFPSVLSRAPHLCLPRHILLPHASPLFAARDCKGKNAMQFASKTAKKRRED